MEGDYLNQLFRISHLNVDDALRIHASPHEPHQHDYETLIIGIQGQLEHFVDFKTTIIEAPLISFIAKGKVHSINTQLVNGQFDVWVLRFKSEFIAETVFQLYASYHNNANHLLQKDTCFDRLSHVCELMNHEMAVPSPDLSVVRHLLSALIIMIESERKKHSPSDQITDINQNETFINFLKIVEANFRRPVGVEFYAEKLFMSARNLNLICQRIMDQSVTELIETRKLTEAKNLLTSTNKSISEIGFELGFNEKAYFSNVFKKKTGQTPTEFRQEMRQLIS